jgi:hypothetical protein
MCADWHSKGVRRNYDPATDAYATAFAEIETYAPCHAVRQTIAPEWVPGAELLDHYLPELLTEALCFADGQAREEVFEYGSFAIRRTDRSEIPSCFAISFCFCPAFSRACTACRSSIGSTLSRLPSNTSLCAAGDGSQVSYRCPTTARS